MGADAIGIANAYDPDTADDIAKVYGYDDAGNIANIKMDSQTRQLRNISKALGQSTQKPAAIQGGANLTTTQSTLTVNVPAEGLYYITDSAGNPIMVGTKSGNANIMKNDAKDPQWRTLGVAVVKSKSMRVDKKVQVQRNGATVGKDGTTDDPVGVTVGDTVTNTVEVTVPNKQAASAVKFKLIDQPKGQTYVKGSLSVRLKNAPQTDITADAIVYDGTTQNNAKSIPGDPTLKTADKQAGRPGSRDSGRRLGHRRQETSRQILQQDDRHHLPHDRRQGQRHRPGQQHHPHVRHIHRRHPLHDHHRPGQGRHQGLRLHPAEGGRGQREHAARRRPVPDPAQRQVDESRLEHRQMVGCGQPGFRHRVRDRRHEP